MIFQTMDQLDQQIILFSSYHTVFVVELSDKYFSDCEYWTVRARRSCIDSTHVVYILYWAELYTQHKIQSMASPDGGEVAGKKTQTSDQISKPPSGAAYYTYITFNLKLYFWHHQAQHQLSLILQYARNTTKLIRSLFRASRPIRPTPGLKVLFQV